MRKNEKRLLAVIVVLAIFAAAMCAWAVALNIQLKDTRVQLAQAIETGTTTEKEAASAQADDAESTTGTQAASADNASGDAGAVAAVFNGGSVTAEEAREEYGTIATYYYGLGMTEDEFSEDLKQTVLENLVQEKILYAKAQALGLTEVSDEERSAIEEKVKAEYEDNIAYYMQFRYDETKTEEEIRSETIEYLNESGLSYDSMLAEAMEGAWRDALYDYAVKDATIDDAKMKEYYDAQVISDEAAYSANFAEYEADADAGRTMAWNPEGVRKIDTILIPFDSAQTARYTDIQAELASGKTEHLDELDTLYAELQDDADAVSASLAAGIDFAELQAQYGVLNEKGTYVSEESTAYGDDFRDAAMGLAAIGDTAGPVCVDAGLVFLRYAGDVAGGTAPYDTIKDALKEEYTQQYKQQVYAAFIDQCMNEADIKYYPENI